MEKKRLIKLVKLLINAKDLWWEGKSVQWQHWSIVQNVVSQERLKIHSVATFHSLSLDLLAHLSLCSPEIMSTSMLPVITTLHTLTRMRSEVMMEHILYLITYHL